MYGFLALAPAAHATPLTLTIQPYHVCDVSVDPYYCGDLNETVYEDFGDKIWAQAGIDIQFLSWKWIAADFADVTDDTIPALLTTASDNPYLVNMWFARSILSCGGSGAGTIFGCSAVGQGLSFISDLVFQYSRYDTIYHEIGHTLGLPHSADSETHNLMAQGSYRLVPTSLNDIAPDGANYDVLTPAQILIADSSSLLTPEPVSWLLIGPGLILAGFVLKIRNR